MNTKTTSKLLVISLLIVLVFPFLSIQFGNKRIRSMFRETLNVDLPRYFSIEWINSPSYFGNFFGLVDAGFILELSDIDKYDLLKNLSSEKFRSKWHVKYSMPNKKGSIYMECYCKESNEFWVYYLD